MRHTEDPGMVTRDVDSASGVVFQVGVITASGAVTLLAQAAATVLNDAATVAALRQALDWAATEQARIHRELYPGEVPELAPCGDPARHSAHGYAGGERWCDGAA